MCKGERFAAVAGAAVFILGTLAAPAFAQSVTQLLKLADRPKDDFRQAVITVRVSRPKEGKAPVSSARFDLYKKGDDRSLIVFTAGKMSGRKVLTVGDKFWLIVPGSTHAIPVTPNQRLIGGASMGDVAKLRFAEEFEAVLEPSAETVDGLVCDVLDLRSKDPRSPYGSGRLWLDRKEHLPRQVMLNLVSGKPAKEVFFGNYKKTAAGVELQTMTIRDLLNPNDQAETLLEYLRYRPAELPDSLFTPTGAQRF